VVGCIDNEIIDIWERRQLHNLACCAEISIDPIYYILYMPSHSCAFGKSRVGILGWFKYTIKRMITERSVLNDHLCAFISIH
jgi:hypothetical protein